MKTNSIKRLMHTALADFASGRGTGPCVEMRGLRLQDVQQAENELCNEHPELFAHVKRSFYEDSKTWWANMDDEGWTLHHQAKKKL